ncbi:MAG: radical SAM protein [Deltaproteobacteria bacterium]|nr:radical SAM protein [Deltaproteobacteria bacterium]
MKVLLLNPPFLPRFSRTSRSPEISKGGALYYPYWLAYAAGVLEDHKFDVKLVDSPAAGYSRQATLGFAVDFNPDLVVCDTSTPSIHNDVEVAAEIKKHTAAFILLVGVHASALPAETLAMNESVDAVARGEYELTLLELAQKIEEGGEVADVAGLTVRKDGKIVNTDNRELIKNLDELPFLSKVYKKYLSIKDYFYPSVRYPEVTILTARGCPFNCSFCNTPFRGSYRTRSVENVIEEFKYIQKELPMVKEVMIEDDTFPINKKRTIELCDRMIEEKINLPWSCNARVDTELEVLKKMKKAGCTLMCVGFESPFQKTLDAVNKKTTKDLQVKFMSNARKAGIKVHGCFILGLPGDTKESIEKAIRFAIELDPQTAQFYPIMVYPDTEAYKWAKENGYLITEDYRKWIDDKGVHNCVVSRPGLGNTDLVELCDRALRRFYFRPKKIINIALSTHDSGDFTRKIIGLKNTLKYFLG